MTPGKTLIIVLVTLIIGFGAGFVLRPLIAPVKRPAIISGPAATPTPAEPRGTQYFAAHLDEARQVVANGHGNAVLVNTVLMAIADCLRGPEG